MFQAGELQSLRKEKGVAVKERAATSRRFRGPRRAAIRRRPIANPTPNVRLSARPRTGIVLRWRSRVRACALTTAISNELGSQRE
jgi:hypothetical protein